MAIFIFFVYCDQVLVNLAILIMFYCIIKVFIIIPPRIMVHTIKTSINKLV